MIYVVQTVEHRKLFGDICFAAALPFVQMYIGMHQNITYIYICIVFFCVLHEHLLRSFEFNRIQPWQMF